jgi:hypothetical protein
METNMRHRTATLVVVLATSLSACGGTVADTTTTSVVAETTTPPETTTTAPSSTTVPDTTTTSESTTTTAGATPEATATLEAIRTAANAGDLDALAELALAPETMFTASFGQDFTDPGDLAAYWSTFEDPTVPEVVLGLLDSGFTRTYANNEDGSQVAINVTPAVMGEDATEADRAQLESIFGAETVDGWYADGMYLGWRLGVDDDGAWRFLVIGD